MQCYQSKGFCMFQLKSSHVLHQQLLKISGMHSLRFREELRYPTPFYGIFAIHLAEPTSL